MAKQGKVLPARRPRDDGSILLRSAESIGRVIGTLQRQLDGARGRLSGLSSDETHTAHNGNGTRPKTKSAKAVEPKSTKAIATRRKAAGSKTKRAAKSTAARKSGRKNGKTAPQ